MIERINLVLFIINAIWGFSGFGLNRISSGLGWVCAAIWVTALFKVKAEMQTILENGGLIHERPKEVKEG